MATKERMKIGIIAPPFLPIVSNMSGYGGTERVVAQLVIGLSDRGHKVTLFASEGSSIPSPNVNIVTVGPALWSKSESGGRTVTNEQIKDGIKRSLDVACRYASKLDVIHSHLDESLQDRRFGRIPTLNTIHGDVRSMNVQVRNASFNNRPLAFISKSQERMVPTANSMGVVYNGINPNSFTPSYKPGDYLVFLGRVSPEKGMHVALDVAKATGTKIVAMYREPILNDGDEVANSDWRYYKEYVKPRFELCNGLLERVVDPKVEVRDQILRGALALIGPSGAPPSTWSEPFGLFVVEAMASGTPAIVYNKGGPAEIVINGETGYIARSTTEKGVIAEMSTAVEKLKAMGSYPRLKSRLRVEKQFSTDKMAEGYEDAYRHVLRRVASAGGIIFSTILGIPKSFTEPTVLLNTATSPSGNYMRDMFYQQFITNIRVLSMIPSQEIPYIVGAGICLSIYLYRDMSVRARHAFN